MATTQHSVLTVVVVEAVVKIFGHFPQTEFTPTPTAPYPVGFFFPTAWKNCFEGDNEHRMRYYIRLQEETLIPEPTLEATPEPAPEATPETTDQTTPEDSTKPATLEGRMTTINDLAVNEKTSTCDAKGGRWLLLVP